MPIKALLCAASLGFALGAAQASPYDDLAAAIRAGDLGQVRQLLARGASARDADAGKAAPLVIAASRGKHDIARALLAAGADPDPRYAAYHDATALMLAVNNRDLAMAELLLERGAGIDLVDSSGDPALHWAVFWGDGPLVDLLLRYKPRTDLVGHGPAVEVAMRRGHQALVARLLDYRGERVRPDVGTSVLIAAIEADDGRAVRTVLAAGANVDALDDTGRPVLARAARQGRLRALEALLNAGATVDALDRIGFSPLMEAARDGQLAACRALAARGAKLDRHAGPRGLAMTPVHLAVAGGQGEVLRWLAEGGAPLDAVDAEGAPPLAWAGGADKKPLAELLLALGAKPLPAKAAQ